jgi:hypothetical protein
VPYHGRLHRSIAARIEPAPLDSTGASDGKLGNHTCSPGSVVSHHQLNRALVLINTLPSAPALRREQIKLQVALITPLLHVSGYASPETKAAVERARLLIEQAEALGEPPEDPLLLFSVLYGHWAASFIAFDGIRAKELAARLLTLAEKQEATVPLMIGHRIMGSTLMVMGEIAAGLVHHDQALALKGAMSRKAWEWLRKATC